MLTGVDLGTDELEHDSLAPAGHVLESAMLPVAASSSPLLLRTAARCGGTMRGRARLHPGDPAPAVAGPRRNQNPARMGSGSRRLGECCRTTLLESPSGPRSTGLPRRLARRRGLCL
jgi:hypothetical protein